MEMEEQRKKAIEMGGHLKDLAATYDLEDDQERHLLKCLAQAYVNEQTRYEYMKLQADMANTPGPVETQNPPQFPFDKGGSEAGGFTGAAA
ncbi:MAG: hypothetical protein HY998_08590 [candidate division NC10 bacterium]|nr:hypothetical protein [candidate division NC10 bacterium]